MSVSEWFTDEELISELASFFTSEEQLQIDFQSHLGLIEEVDEDNYKVTINKRIFTFHKELLGVEEVEI